MREYLLDKVHRDQDPEKKTAFVRIAKEGDVTLLRAFGISNPTVKQLAKGYFRKGYSFNTVLSNCDEMIRSARHTEEIIFALYLIEFYKSTDERLFRAADVWIDLIDHWMMSDHLSINAMRHYTVENHIDEIRVWTVSDNFWRRRQSVTIFLKHMKKTEVRKAVLANMTELLGDRNYYVRKAIPWVLRECSKFDLDGICRFLEDNIKSFSKTELREASKRIPERERLLELYLKR